MNHDTREFQDGVLTASARLVVKEPPETNCWIVNDGDIDPLIKYLADHEVDYLEVNKPDLEEIFLSYYGD